MLAKPHYTVSVIYMGRDSLTLAYLDNEGSNKYIYFLKNKKIIDMLFYLKIGSDLNFM
jgi:hypothetical protein